MKIPVKVKRKLSVAKKKAATFWKNKKNRKVVFFVIGAVIIYIIVRKKGTGTNGKPTDTFTGNSGTKGGTITPPDNSNPGDVNYKLITKGMDEHMSISRRTEGDMDYITDTSTLQPSPGREFRYMLGSVVITRSTPLNNYPVARNNGFRVWKMRTKIGLDSVNRWSDTPEQGGYYDHEAGEGFSNNVTAAIQSGYYAGAQSGFENHLPATFNPALKMPQWADISPNLQLPKGRFFVLSKGDWSIQQVMQKGVTHISHYALPRPGGDESQAAVLKSQGITYNDVPTSYQVFGYIPNNPSNAEVDAMVARHNACDALMICETMEQSHSIDPNTNQWLRRFIQGVVAIQKSRFVDKGIPALFCYNYFQFWPSNYHLGQVSREVSKAMLRTAPAQMQNTQFSPGGVLSDSTLIVEAVYLSAPDIQQGTILDHAFKLTVFKHMGYVGGTFLAGEHEWKPNNMFEYTYAEGKYYNKYKMPVDPSVVTGHAFLSQVYGKVFVNWGASGKVNAGPVFDKFTFEPTHWLANGSSQYKSSTPNPNYNGGGNGDIFPWITHPDFPHAVPGGVGYFAYNGVSDLCRFGLQIFADTWGQLEGGTENYLDYRVDGGAWVLAANRDSDDLVDCWHDKRGYVHSINRGGDIAWYWLNPFADTLWHDLEVKFPNGKIVKNRVAGNGVHAKLERM